MDTLQKDAGVDTAIAETKISLFKERTQKGTQVENGGRYLRRDLVFAGSPTHSATIWGRREKGDDNSGAVQLRTEEKLRLAIEGKKWTWKQDFH